MSNKTGKGLSAIDYMIGKSKTREGADSLARRTNETLALLGDQEARVFRIANAHGTYGYAVKVTTPVVGK